MKHTAVDWLGNEIANRITRRNPHDTIIIQTQGEILIELIEQAKEMEKKEKLKYQLFIGKVMEIIGYETTIELLKECNETFKSE
jgi:hypothetical protein